MAAVSAPGRVASSGQAKTEARKSGSRPAAMLGPMRESKRMSTLGRPATDAEWEAIRSRHGSARPFIFLVASTGIVCTPGCPARTPGRDRVRVITRMEECLAAGARACLRCRPDRLFGSPSAPEAGQVPATEGIPAGRLLPGEQTSSPDPVQTIVERLSAALMAGDDIPSERELAGELHLPERRLREQFRRSLGVTPRAWLSARRAEMLRSRLAEGQVVTAALYDAGYGSSSAAYEAANGALGMAPGRYRTGAAGESIRWTVAPIPEGVALVAATDRGLCSIRLGHEVEAMASDLRAEFPRASLERDDAALSHVASIVSDLGAGRRRPEADSLPLDVHATAFRRRVWEALRRIPFGETRSYGEIAAEVGAPGAARAVGTACARNPVPVVVPCHRVVGSDGSLHGYAYGLARKRQLLDAEAGAYD